MQSLIRKNRLGWRSTPALLAGILAGSILVQPVLAHVPHKSHLDKRYLKKTSPAGGDLTGTFSNLQIGANAVGANEIASNAVTTAKIADNAVTLAKMADNSVGSPEVTDNSLTGADISDAALPTSAQAQNATVVGLDPAGTIVVQTTITTAATSRILATGAVELSGAEADERATCNISIGGVGSIFYETTFDDIGTGNEVTVPVTFGRDNVPAGTNIPVVMTCSELTGVVTKDDAGLTVIAIPNPT